MTLCKHMCELKFFRSYKDPPHVGITCDSCCPLHSEQKKLNILIRDRVNQIHKISDFALAVPSFSHFIL